MKLDSILNCVLLKKNYPKSSDHGIRMSTIGPMRGFFVVEPSICKDLSLARWVGCSSLVGWWGRSVQARPIILQQNTKDVVWYPLSFRTRPMPTQESKY